MLRSPVLRSVSQSSRGARASSRGDKLVSTYHAQLRLELVLPKSERARSLIHCDVADALQLVLHSAQNLRPCSIRQKERSTTTTRVASCELGESGLGSRARGTRRRQGLSTVEVLGKGLWCERCAERRREEGGRRSGRMPLTTRRTASARAGGGRT